MCISAPIVLRVTFIVLSSSCPPPIPKYYPPVFVVKNKLFSHTCICGIHIETTIYSINVQACALTMT